MEKRLHSLQFGEPCIPCMQIQDPSTLLHNPSLQFSEQFCLQSSPYFLSSHAIKQKTRDLIFLKLLYNKPFHKHIHTILNMFYLLKMLMINLNHCLLLNAMNSIKIDSMHTFVAKRFFISWSTSAITVSCCWITRNVI